MRNIIKALILSVFLATSLSFFGTAFAYSPYLSVSGSTITITGAQPNAAVVITYMPSGSNLNTTITGTTDYNGYFSVQASSVNSQVSATVGGQQVYSYNNGGSGCGNYGCGTCTYNCGSPYGLSLSQNSLSLSAGQSSTINIINGSSYYGYNTYYISSNTNSSVAAASISGSSLYIVAGYQSGTTSISVCQSGSSNSCASLYVTVTGSSCTYYGCNNNGAISLSPSTLNLTLPQTASVSIINGVYGGSGYYISSNSNSYVASASISGNILYVSSLVVGNTTITVCQSGNSSQCASLVFNVTGANCYTYGCSGPGALSLSQTSFNLTVGQSVTVSAYNASGLYVSSNSNSGVVSVSASGNQAIFYGQSNGSSTVVLCSSGNSQCASVYVTIGGGNCIYSNCNGTISFSPSSVNLNLGQSSTVTIYNSYSAGTFYISSNSNPAIASASISGSSLYLLAGSVGSTTITVCQNGLVSCGTLYVTVNSLGGSGNTLSLSQTSLNLSSGQTASVTAYNGSGIYISSNSNPVVATYSISGNQLNVTGSGIGSTTLNICSNSGYGCATLYVNVSGTACSYYGCGNGTNISLSQNSLSLGGGQTGAVTIYGNGSYYISSNSSSWVANATLSGSLINVTAIQTGTTNIYVCQNGGSSACATLYVTVAGGVGYYGTTNVVLSQTSLNLSLGQSATVNASGNGGYGYYLSTNSNPGAVSASFSGSVLTVYGSQNGNSTIQVCQNAASACASLYVTVGSAYAYNPNPVNNNPGSSLQYPGTGSSSVLGASTYPNGELIAEGQTVYIVYRGTKTAFASGAAFTGLGFSFNNVVQVGNSGLPSSGYTITTSRNSHPWGSWIKNGSTVYFVQELGLIPVPNWSTFLNNGGSANLIVNANSYDFRLPILSPMTSSDSRLY